MGLAKTNADLPETTRADERIAVLLPRRNIETWIHFLNGEQVDETTVYPKLPRESECHAAVDRLAAKGEYNLSPDVPESLWVACSETRRVFPSKRYVESSRGMSATPPRPGASPDY